MLIVRIAFVLNETVMEWHDLYTKVKLLVNTTCFNNTNLVSVTVPCLCYVNKIKLI